MREENVNAQRQEDRFVEAKVCLRAESLLPTRV